MKSLMRVEKGGYLEHIKVSALEQPHERMESSATAAISAAPTERPLPFPPLSCSLPRSLSLSLSLSVASTATVKQVEQNDALQCFSQPLVHSLQHTHTHTHTHTQTHTRTHTHTHSRAHTHTPYEHTRIS